MLLLDCYPTEVTHFSPWLPQKLSRPRDEFAAYSLDEEMLNTTNEELFRLFDPSSPTMPYVYDNFKWDHCTGVNSSSAHGTHG